MFKRNILTKVLLAGTCVFALFMLFSMISACTLEPDLEALEKEALESNGFKITYDAMGIGDDPKPDWVIRNGLIKSMPVPVSYSGDTFGWWLKQDPATDAWTIPWDFQNDKVTGNVTLHAEWNTEGYSVVFFANGGEFSSGDYYEIINVTDESIDDSPGKSMPAAIKSLYTFIEWNTKSDGSGTTFESDTTVTKSIAVYAQYAIAYSVAADGSDKPGDITTKITFTFDADIRNLKPALTKSNITLIPDDDDITIGAWNEVSGSNGTIYELAISEFKHGAEIDVSIDKAGIVKEPKAGPPLIVYAEYITYTVSSDGSSTPGDRTTTITFIFDNDIDDLDLDKDDIKLSADKGSVTKGTWTEVVPGIEFDLAISGFTSGAEITVSISKLGIIEEPTSGSPVTVYNVAPPGTYTVTFDENYPTGNDKYEEIHVLEGESIESSGEDMPPDPTSRQYYSFVEWNTEKAGPGTTFDEYIPVTEDITVYARWKTLSSIEITEEPTKTGYTAGQNLNLSGLVVTAIYDDSSDAVITTYSTDPAEGTILAVADDEVEVSYTEKGVTKEATFKITVTPALSSDTEISKIEIGGVSVSGASLGTADTALGSVVKGAVTLTFTQAQASEIKVTAAADSEQRWCVKATNPVLSDWHDDSPLTAPLTDGNFIWFESKAEDETIKYYAIVVSIFTPVEGITLASSILKVDASGYGTLTLNPTIDPAEATNQTIIWDDGAWPVGIGLDGNDIKAEGYLTPGTFDINATITNGEEIGKDYEDTFTITVEVPSITLSMETGLNPAGLRASYKETTKIITLSGTVDSGFSTEITPEFFVVPGPSLFDSDRESEGYSYVSLVGLYDPDESFTITQYNQSLNLYATVNNIDNHGNPDVYKEKAYTGGTVDEWFVVLLWNGATEAGGPNDPMTATLEVTQGASTIVYTVDWSGLTITP